MEIDGYPVAVRRGINLFTVTAGTHLVQVFTSWPSNAARKIGLYVDVPANGVEHFYLQPPVSRIFPTRVGTTPQPMAGTKMYAVAFAALPFVMLGLIAVLLLAGRP